MPGKEKLMIDLYLRPYSKTAERTINITSILHNFKSLIKQVYEKKCTQKCKKKEISFGSIFLEIFTICSPNTTELQETKEDKNCQIYTFLFFNSPISHSDRSRIIFRKRKNCTLNIRFLYQFIQSSK